MCVPVTVPPISEPLHAGGLRFDEMVGDWRVLAVVPDGVEESRVGVLEDCEFLASDGGGEWFRCHGVSHFLSVGVVGSRSSWASSFPFW